MESTKRSNAIILSLSTLNSSFIAPRSSITEYNFFPIASSFYTRTTWSPVWSYVITTKSSLCKRTRLGALSRRRPIAARNTRRRVPSIRSIGIVSKVRNSTRLMKIYRCSRGEPSRRCSFIRRLRVRACIFYSAGGSRSSHSRLIQIEPVSRSSLKIPDKDG